MMNRLLDMLPRHWLLGKIFWGVVMASVVMAAFSWGRYGGLNSVKALPPTGADGSNIPAHLLRPTTDYQQRVVAYLYNGKIALSREDLGEYLITRYGMDRIQNLINRRIIDKECRDRGVYITDAEIKFKVDEFLKGLSKNGPPISEADFARQVLKPSGKTLTEWKEDVIRPNLSLAKLVEALKLVEVTPQDLKDGFEARFGPKVKCRMIVMSPTDRAKWNAIWEEVRNNESKFLERARHQYMEALAAKGGEVPPIHKHFGDPRIEKEAFSLKVGEVGSIIELPDQTAVILRCEGHLPPDDKANFDQVRVTLYNEIREFKLNQKIPELFQELRRRADPKVILNDQIRQDDLERAVHKEIYNKASMVRTTGDNTPMMPPPPAALPDLFAGPPPGAVVAPMPTLPSNNQTPAPRYDSLTQPPPVSSSNASKDAPFTELKK